MKVSLSHLYKSYGPVQALVDVSAEFGPSEVHALLGENGSGKSTLAKVLAGLLVPSAGEFFYDGERHDSVKARSAVAAGVCMVTQEGSLAPELTVGENLLAAELPRRFGKISWSQVRRRAAAALEGFGLDLDPGAKVGALRIDQRQMLEIARALTLEPKVLILDEATSSLTGDQVEALFAALRRLRGAGATIVFISHRLSEVREIADRATVLRDGHLVRVVDDLPGTSDHDLVLSMVGRPPSAFYHKVAVEPGEELLSVQGLRTKRLRGVSLSVARGEVLGVAGLVGSGRTSLAETLFGLWPTDAGEVRVEGGRVRLKGPRQAIQAGLVLVPEDRKRSGLVLGATIGANLSMCRHEEISQRGIIRGRREQLVVDRQFGDLRIKAPGTGTVVANLSGGNQQKVVLGRVLATSPRLMLLDEPARGMDVGAKSDLFQLIGDLVQEGMGVIFISSEIPDLIALADRILVLYEGAVAGEIGRAEASEERLGALITGAHPEPMLAKGPR
ncbi:MAG: sugar ABC transporter ATP-binding protein [Actinobacteria bacterium]|nr:sugar ABC transporter ATP-binding protein [Actinomycetota bacterium]